MDAEPKLYYSSILKLLLTTLLVLLSVTGFSQFPINNPISPFNDSIVYTGFYSGVNSNTIDARDLGMPNGLVYNFFPETSWPLYKLYWGFDINDGVKISAQGPNGSHYTHSGTELTMDATSSDLPNGTIIFTGYTTFGYYSSSNAWVTSSCLTKFQLTVETPTGSPIPLLLLGNNVLVDITTYGNFVVSAMMTALSPTNALYISTAVVPGTYTPVIYLFDNLHNWQTNVYDKIYTTFNHNYYTNEDIWIGNNIAWNDVGNWSFIDNLPKPPYNIRIPSSPAGGNLPSVDVHGTVIVNNVEVESGAILTVKSATTFACGDDFTFDTVYNPITGKTWMDRNLGASRAATSVFDFMAFGHLFQWGRNLLSVSGDKDNHEYIEWLNTTLAIPVYSTTSTNATSDYPGHSYFITEDSSPYDWRVPQNNNLWQGADGTNNPCPSGYRLPTQEEWNAERLSWASNDAAGAYGSPLKLTTSGYRSRLDGLIIYNSGSYLSSTISGTNIYYLWFTTSTNSAIVDGNGQRAFGRSVRCIKDTPR